MKFLFQSIAEGDCLLNLDAATMPEIVEATVEFLVQTGKVSESLAGDVVRGVLEHEKLVPTVIGHAFAIPHFYDDMIEEPAIVFVRLKHAVNLGAPDGVATRYVFLMIGPTGLAAQHLDSLSAIARLMSDNVFHFETIYAKNRQDVLDAIERHVQRNVLAMPPAPRRVAEGLKFNPVPLGGLIGDWRRRAKHYVADFRDGLKLKSIASIIFMFFACLAPAVTFGGFMGLETGGAIAAPEMLIATSVCGVLYALFAGGPLIIIGGIGPLLIFTIILYQLCRDAGYEDQFLGVYGWVGLWTAGLTALLAIFNASNLMRFFTRFTDEIFSALMSLIFIYKAIEALWNEFQSDSAAGSYEKALLALVLAVGTFYIAMTLAGFRKSRYLVPWMREFLADFGPSIALVAMIAVAWTLGDSSTLETLRVSRETEPTSTGWLVDFGGVPVWIRWAAAGPAALATMLIYLSQNITSRLINGPGNRLTKGEVYHWDLLVIAVLIALCSSFGWPWMVAATVRSLAHVRALADVKEVVQGDDRREEVIHVNDNRITGIAIHALIGATLLVLPLLEYIPMACLYGIFLYMGFQSLRGVQFIERLGYWLMDSKLYPINHYTRRVPARTIHLFTLIQLLCLIVLCLINVSPYEPVRILFPVFIALLVPVRFAINAFFDRDHLNFLDADEQPDEENLHWV